MLIWIFGGVRHHEVHLADDRRMAGFLELEKAQVRWFLSVGKEDLPAVETKAGKTTYRSITVGGEEIDFSGGFTDLHTVVYQGILAGRGFGVEETRSSIDLVYKLRNSVAVRNDVAHTHPWLIKP